MYVYIHIYVNKCTHTHTHLHNKLALINGNLKNTFSQYTSFNNNTWPPVLLRSQKDRYAGSGEFHVIECLSCNV